MTWRQHNVIQIGIGSIFRAKALVLLSISFFSPHCLKKGA